MSAPLIPTSSFANGTNLSNTNTSTNAQNIAANNALANGTSTASANSANSLSSTMSQFLQILTTELQNQDPTQPLDASQFVGQLATLNQVQATVQSNTLLTQIEAQMQASAGANASSYIGDEITAQSGVISLTSGGSAEFGYTIPSGTTLQSAQIVVTDSSGNQVFTTAANTTAGNYTYTWNGDNSSGTAEPAGNYTVTVNTVDSSGNKGTASTVIANTVAAVDLTQSSGPELVLSNGSEVPLTSVQTVEKPSTTSSSN